MPFGKKFEKPQIPEEEKGEEIEKSEEKFEHIPEEEKEKFMELTEEMKGLYNDLLEGELEIGELNKKIEKYKEVDTSNPTPKKIEMPTVVDYKGIKAEGATLGKEGVETCSTEFKEFLESNTRIN